MSRANRAERLFEISERRPAGMSVAAARVHIGAGLLEKVQPVWIAKFSDEMLAGYIREAKVLLRHARACRATMLCIAAYGQGEIYRSQSDEHRHARRLLAALEREAQSRVVRYRVGIKLLNKGK
jgi:hypothetical protein